MRPYGRVQLGDRFKFQWKVFAWYWGGGILSVLLICFRNMWLGGKFYPTAANNPVLIGDQGSFPLADSLYTILAGNSLSLIHI